MHLNSGNFPSSGESQSVASSEILFRDGESQHADDNNDTPESASTRNDRPDSPTDTKAVLFLRIAFIGVWLAVAIVFSVSVYSLTTREEDKDFRRQFSTLADKAFDAFQANVEQSMYMLDLLSISYTSYALDRNLTWPFVTLPDFEIVAARARHLVQNGGVISFAPIVPPENRVQWESYSVDHQDWAAKALEYRHFHPEFYRDFGTTKYGDIRIPPVIWSLGPDGLPEADNTTVTALPVWQTAPIQDPPIAINYNVLSIPSVRESIDKVVEHQEAILSKFLTAGQQEIPRPSSSPWTALFYPVFQNFRDRTEREIVGIVSVELFWENFLKRLLPNSANGIFAVLGNTCGQVYTFEILGKDATYIGEGDSHDHNFDYLEESKELHTIKVPGLLPINDMGCQLSLKLYPSASFRESFVTQKPKVYTVATAFMFMFTLIMFLLYDWLVKRRHRVLKREANRSNAIVTSLFPTVVRDRLLRNAEESQELHAPVRHASDIPSTSHTSPVNAPRFGRRLSLLHGVTETPKTQLKTFLNDSASTASATSTRDLHNTAPIADLFPNTTILFADIAGFTAWCSEREPTQVFMLLETIYCAFDNIAKLNGVFKVETIGDCYVAVTGLPDPQEDHAVIMASFARACIKTMQKLTKKLEATLGPGTADLAIRVGLHSGPVTAGVLRGDKSRFQLFGDTVNTASRMESNGSRNRIHVSEETAMLLVAAGRKHWIRPREDVIVAKGKGKLHTYWLLDKGELHRETSKVSFSLKGASGAPDSDVEEIEAIQDQPENQIVESNSSSGVWGTTTISENQCIEVMDPNKLARLVDWNVDLILGRLKAILANRNDAILPINFNRDAGCGLQYSTPREEVADVISFPDFDPAAAIRKKNPETIEVDPEVVCQLRKYVSVIASMYRSNPFHNFEHASHVAMSSNKLLQRVIAPEDVDYRRGDVSEKQRRKEVATDLHVVTFGIASDTLTQFAVVFSALIHDVDHSGLSNTQMIEQRDPIAIKYKSKSIAEQNSIDVAWSLLMMDDYADLRRCINSSESEARRFRQLVVNSVVATDLFDSELRTLRINRWEKAFCKREEEVPSDESAVREDLHRKATTVIEHIIQASDVAHTMQHWHIYQRWNEKLFHEQFSSFQRGLSSKDPSLHWYQGELDFFDSYIIPLAHKLKDSGVFGVSGDEYLVYALENRKEWALKGEKIVGVWRDQLKSSCLS